MLKKHNGLTVGRCGPSWWTTAVAGLLGIVITVSGCRRRRSRYDVTQEPPVEATDNDVRAAAPQ